MSIHKILHRQDLVHAIHPDIIEKDELNDPGNDRKRNDDNAQLLIRENDFEPVVGYWHEVKKIRIIQLGNLLNLSEMAGPA